MLNCQCNKLITINSELHAIVDLYDPHITASLPTSDALNGVHIGVKDMIAIKGTVKGNGNPRCKESGNPESVHAPVIEAMLQAGAQIAATTSLLEYAAGAQHPELPETRNPQNLSLTAGGSSSGSAALVGAGALELAIGTDTGGSIRIPAAYCGCYGIKPTYGAISVEGVTPLSPSFDHLGFLGGSLEIIEAALASTIKNWEGQLLNEKGEGKLTIGIPRAWIEDPRNESEIYFRFIELEKALTAAGHRLIDIDISPLEQIRATFMAIVLFEAWQVHGEQMEKNPHHFGGDTQRLFNFAQEITSTQYQAALSARENLMPEVHALFTDLDLLMMPAVPYFAPTQTPPLDSELGAYEGLYTEVFNATGNPALVSPCNSTTMKIGIQCVGKYGSDRQLLHDAKIIDKFLN